MSLFTNLTSVSSMTSLPSNPNDLILREFGSLAQRNQNLNIISALRDPAESLKIYNENLEKYAALAGDIYKSNVEELKRLGLPYEQVHKISMNIAGQTFLANKAILDLKNPLFGDDMHMLTKAASKKSVVSDIKPGKD